MKWQVTYTITRVTPHTMEVEADTLIEADDKAQLAVRAIIDKDEVAEIDAEIHDITIIEDA